MVLSPGTFPKSEAGNGCSYTVLVDSVRTILFFIDRCVADIRFLSTPSARRATGLGDKWFQDHQISIHALREEGDHSPVGGGDVEGISIHALREEGDVRKGRKMQWYGSFLSTPSARRAT